MDMTEKEECSELITISQTIQGVGFRKPGTHLLPGVIGNGKVTYLNTEEAVCPAETEQALVKALKKEPRCIGVVIRRADEDEKGQSTR